MRITLKFAYNGKKYQGYARQPQLKTVEGEIIKALIKHGFIEDTKNSYFKSASRTDKGVSALGNVIAFNTKFSKKCIIKELNDELIDMLFYGVIDVESDFYPRYAKYRIYRYYLKNINLKMDKILSAAGAFAGSHNFTNFAKLENFKDPVRIINNIIVTNQGKFLIIDFYAQTFLWHQVRRIVSAILKMNLGEIEKEQIIEALHNPNKKFDFGLSPAEPLILKDILYDFKFEYDPKLIKSLKEFEKNLVSLL
jgi:tRNA pseudouridine38-40 synthase